MFPKALVTGATGFIGNHLVENLVSKKWEITCWVRPKSRIESLRRLPVSLIKGKLDDCQLLEQAVEGQDYIFHLAARIRSAPKMVYDRVNHQFTRNLVSACLNKNPGVKRFVYVSSISAAGPSPPGIHSKENHSSAPTSEYGKTKLRGEEAIREVWDQIPATIIRPPNVYGPRQQETELLIKLISKRIVPILKDTAATTSLIYVKDLVQGLLQAALSTETTKHTYYLTDGKGYSWRKIILAIKQAVLGESLFVPLPEEIIAFFAWLADLLKATGIVRPYFGRRAWRAMTQTPWLFSVSKAKNDFGFQALYSLEDGMKETIKLRPMDSKTIVFKGDNPFGKEGLSP